MLCSGSLTFAAGSTSGLTITGTFSNTGTGCTATGLGGATINAANQAVTAGSSTSTVPVPITYTGTLPVVATSISATAATLAYTINGAVPTVCSASLTAPTAVTESALQALTGWVTAASWTVTVEPTAAGGTVAGTAKSNCCYPTAFATTSANSVTTVTVTWPSAASTACTALGIPTGATAYTTATATASGTHGQLTIPVPQTLVPSPQSTITLNTASTATWVYYDGNTCTYTLKKSSSASKLIVSFATLLSVLFYITA